LRRWRFVTRRSIVLALSTRFVSLPLLYFCL
jgi:hypothetical protein